MHFSALNCSDFIWSLQWKKQYEKRYNRRGKYYGKRNDIWRKIKRVCWSPICMLCPTTVEGQSGFRWNVSMSNFDMDGNYWGTLYNSMKDILGISR